jgi:haloalkane dehalogenase
MADTGRPEWVDYVDEGSVVELASRLMGGPVGLELIRRFNVFVNATIPAGHRLRKPTAAEMAHYREGAGHFVQSDAPGEFAAAIRDWRSARTPSRGRES